MEELVRLLCRKEGLNAQRVQPLSGGQVNRVFLVDQTYVVRIGGRKDAFERLERETQLLRRLAGQSAVAKVYAFGQQDEHVYQIQQYIPGTMLYRTWGQLGFVEQEAVVADLAANLKAIHGLGAPCFGAMHRGAPRYESWADFLSDKFQHTLAELRALQIRMVPGIVELAAEYFEAHRAVLEGGVPTVVHSDLTMVNILVDRGRLAALLDFEYALQAPADYELWVMEAFCLYPNDWAEEGNEVYCTADFARFIPLLRREYPELFALEHLRERVNLYQLDAALSSYLAWRKDNLATIPPEQMAAKEFYMSKITNFIFSHGAKFF